VILWGWGKRTFRDWGPAIFQTCPTCKNSVWFRLVTIRTWFTIFFTPVIPYRVRHLLMCPTCTYSIELDAAEFAHARQAMESDDTEAPPLIDRDVELTAARERDTAYLESHGTEAQGSTDADRLRARLENRNRNWDDRR
jgi:zinc-ribbon family